MEWLNLEVSVIRRPEYVACDPVARATWLNVLAYCVEQENGGRVTGAKAWRDRQWQQTCGVMAREVSQAAPLLKFQGSDLVVLFYPSEKQREIEAKRLAARSTNNQRWAQRGKSDSLSDPLKLQQSESLNGSLSESHSESGREGNRKGIGKGIRKERTPRAGERSDSLTKAPQTLENLDCPAFLAAWEDWRSHWSQTFGRGRPMPTQTANAHLRLCEEEAAAGGPEAAVEALVVATSRGLREPARKNRGPTGVPAAPFDPSKPNAHTSGLPDFTAAGASAEETKT